MRFLIGLGVALFAAGAGAFPNGPISVVVPLAPGDAADISARTIGEEISRILNVPVVAVNRPGAGGAVGAASVAQARKDGQTILFPPNAALTFRAVLEPQVATYKVTKQDQKTLWADLVIPVKGGAGETAKFTFEFVDAYTVKMQKEGDPAPLVLKRAK